jgi:hypothetical protein
MVGTVSGLWWLEPWYFEWLSIYIILGIIIPTDFHIFQRGWNHQPVTILGGLKNWEIRKTPWVSILKSSNDLDDLRVYPILGNLHLQLIAL